MEGGQDTSTLRRRVYYALEGGTAGGLTGGFFESALIALIVLNVIAFTLQSLPWFEAAYHDGLEIFEIVSIALFTIEYVLRIWSAPEDPLAENRGPVRGRIHFATRPMMLLDFFAVAPAYVALFIPFLDLRVLRLIRLLRLLKIARYSPALSTLARVIVAERRALYGTLLLLFCATMFAAAAMHAAEGAIQPKRFGTIPDSMWWAITTLTTVGYGDVVPITPLGRMIAGLTMVMGLGLFALPVGIVATGFVQSIHRRDFVVTFAMLSRVPMFKGFDAQMVGEIMQLLHAHTLGPGAIISAEGEQVAAMYFIVAGEVEAQLPKRKVRFGSGDFFGELALLHDTMRAATIVAVTHVRLLTLSVEDFDMLLRRHPGLKRRIHHAAAAGLQNIAESFAISETEIEAARRMREEARRA